jgi:hypothetical protein
MRESGRNYRSATGNLHSIFVTEQPRWRTLARRKRWHTNPRHCEARSDVAIHTAVQSFWNAGAD